MTSIIIRQGAVITPSSHDVADVLIVDGVIAQIGERIDAPSGAVEIVKRRRILRVALAREHSGVIPRSWPCLTLNRPSTTSQLFRTY
jgi:predicted amidohydrolase